MRLLKKGCETTNCFFCKYCLAEWQPAIEAHRKTFEIKKGGRLFAEGDKVKGIFFVTDGIIKVHKKWGSEKELIIRIASKGTPVGHRGIGTHISTYPVSATALETSTLCFIGLDFFTASLKINQELNYQLLLFFADELHESEQKMRNLAHMSVKGRVSLALLAFSQKFGTTPDGFINIRLSKQDIADYTGATYETVFRVLNELTAEGAISMSGKQIQLMNGAYLSAHGKSKQ